ncbi:MAG TPA: hypothetical protein DIC34_10020 [Treponema sp.]|nr:MAG: hypothetical protein A2001_15540 [Treponema sp. GWC1_61_84]OHE76787.1 MAG: hypothetical protein A2413_15755 [Treponema sp. RIFOXYC1_FULL_61_9]HCM26862.1 hypothetical protein [Treponema sp.]
MKSRTWVPFRTALALTFVISCAASCSFIQSLIGSLIGSDDKKPVPSKPPTEAVELADGVFGLIGMIFESPESDPTLAQGYYPAGMSVAWITPDTALRITLENFTPPDDPGGLVANGEIDLTQTNADPFTISIAGSIILTNHFYGTASLNGNAVWAAGTGPGDAEPQSVTGTFTVDGKDWAIADLLAAMDDDGGDGGTVTAYPVPDIYKGAQLHSAYRIEGPSNIPDLSFIFYISGDGKYYTMNEGYLTCEGTIKWYMDSGWQLLQFHDDANANDRFFVVMEYDASYLRLNIGFPPTTWQFTVVRY